VTVPTVATPKPSATAASNRWPFLLLLAPFAFWGAWVASDLAVILLTTGGDFLVTDRANVENIVEICLFSFGFRDINLVEKRYSPIVNLFSTRHFGLSSHSLLGVETKGFVLKIGLQKMSPSEKVSLMSPAFDMYYDRNSLLQ
jgi:hypothetical protein